MFMSVESPEVGENIESHPLYKPFRQRCLMLVDENGKALDSDKPMRTESLPDLAIVYAIGEGAEDPNVGGENCKRFMEWATELLKFTGKNREFTYAESALLQGGSLVNLLVIDGRVDSGHVEKLRTAYGSAYELKKHVGLAFARFQTPQLNDEVYEGFCLGEMPLPQEGTPARTILDRVTLMKNLDLSTFGDRNADYILYTGGDSPVPYAYSRMEVLASGSEIEIIRPYQLVYGLQTGALIRATNPQREERAENLDAYIEKCKNLEGYVGKDSVSQDIFSFKSRT